MDDIDAMYRAGRARQGGKACPSGGGMSNGGRVAKMAYASGGRVDDTPPKPSMQWERPKPKPSADMGGGMRRMESQEAGRPVGLKRGGRAC
jgi:hypothetical protein